MKNRYMKLLSALLFSTVLSAQETGYSLSVAGVGMSMDYSEYLEDGELSNTEESDLNGIMGIELGIAYTEVLESKNYTQIGLNFQILAGETQYTGGIIGSGLGYGSYLSATKDVVFDIEAEYKYNYILSDELEVSYGIGLGYREWYRELSPYQIEIYSWFSLRPKIGLTYNIDAFSIGGNLEYQYALNPEMVILANAENPDTTVSLGSGDIIEFSIPLKYAYSETINLFVEYTYQYQNIEESNKVDYIHGGSPVLIWEPRSEAYNQYLKFGAEFKF